MRVDLPSSTEPQVLNAKSQLDGVRELDMDQK